MSDNKPTLRAQACHFVRTKDAKGSIKNLSATDWEPGIAFLDSFDVSDVIIIVDASGKPVPRTKLHDYNLLQLRVDGYIAIEPGDYIGKRYSPKVPDAPRGDPAHDYR